MKKETVCAVVVTYNRKNLLIECLEALRRQTRPVNAIYLIDNASTDGTPKLLLEHEYIKELPPENLNEPWEKTFIIKNLTNGGDIKLHYVRMHENTGGAGGFYEGVKRAYKRGYDWLWLMDDDTIATEQALKKLLNKVDYLSVKYPNYKIGFICSTVLWTDNTPHYMNIPQIRPIVNGIPFNKFYTNEIPICCVESCSFVSVLISRYAIEYCGLPIKEFFIWGDDVEYTSRITSKGFVGIYALDSIVYHKTKNNYCVDISKDNPKNAWKYYYDTRNKIFILKKRKNLLLAMLSVSLQFINDLRNIMKRDNCKIKFLRSILKGYIDGIFFNPKIEKCLEKS